MLQFTRNRFRYVFLLLAAGRRKEKQSSERAVYAFDIGEATRKNSLTLWVCFFIHDVLLVRFIVEICICCPQSTMYQLIETI